jgi:hypothetical protein
LKTKYLKDIIGRNIKINSSLVDGKYKVSLPFETSPGISYLKLNQKRQVFQKD